MTHIEFPGDVDSPDAGIRVSRRIADELRCTRVLRNLSIEDVAATLRIRDGFIEAMEEDRFDDLPGSAYISGFLRTYANYLGLDGDQLVAWFKDDNQSTFAPREMGLPVPVSEVRRPTFPIITVSLVAAVGIAVAWYVIQERQSIDIDLVPEVPGSIVENTSTGLSDDAGSNALDGDDVFDAVGEAATAEPDAETKQVAGAGGPPDTVGTAGDGDAADLASDAVVGSPDDAGSDALDGDEVFDAVGEAATAADVPPDTVGTAGDGDAADLAPDAVVGSPDGAAAGEAADIRPSIVDDGANDAVTDGGTDTRQGEAGVALQDLADATGVESGGDESWDAAVFASGDTVQEPAAVAEEEADDQHTVYGTPGAGSRIELRAIDETWVQITAPDGVAVLTHILLPGDVYHVPHGDGLMLDTGNAGGLEIRVDGELMPPLGGTGAVVRDVLLSVETLIRR